jgi:hypothetical protein
MGSKKAGNHIRASGYTAGIVAVMMARFTLIMFVV